MRYDKLIYFILVLISVCVDLEAVQREFKIRKIDFNYRTVSAEETTVAGLDRSKLRGLGKVQGWGMIELYYESKPKWADDVEVKYYVLMKGESANKPVMLAGSVIYVYVAEGEEHVSTIYIPPQAIKRYGDVLKIRAELWYNGILQDAILWPRVSGKIPWWTRIKPTYGSLFNRFYTPFEHEAQAREEVIKTE